MPILGMNDRDGHFWVSLILWGLSPTHGDLHGEMMIHRRMEWGSTFSVVDQVSSEGMAPDRLHEGLHCQQPWISERWINMELLNKLVAATITISIGKS